MEIGFLMRLGGRCRRQIMGRLGILLRFISRRPSQLERPKVLGVLLRTQDANIDSFTPNLKVFEADSTMRDKYLTCCEQNVPIPLSHSQAGEYFRPLPLQLIAAAMA